VAGRFGQIDEVFADDAAHAVACAPNPGRFPELARFEHRETLVDHRRGAAALGDHDFAS